MFIPALSAVLNPQSPFATLTQAVVLFSATVQSVDFASFLLGDRTVKGPSWMIRSVKQITSHPLKLQ